MNMCLPFDYYFIFYYESEKMNYHNYILIKSK